MRAGNGQARLPCMPGLHGHAVQQQGRTGNRLKVFVRLSQAYEQIPPVIDERDHARHQTAACQILGREAQQFSIQKACWTNRLVTSGSGGGLSSLVGLGEFIEHETHHVIPVVEPKVQGQGAGMPEECAA